MIRGRTKTFLIVANLVVVLLLPFAVIAVRREVRSATPRWAIIPDMDEMPYGTPQKPSAFFADGRVMRPHIAGTMARQDFIFLNIAAERADPNHYQQAHVVLDTAGKYNRIMLGQTLSGGQGTFVKRIPLPVTRAFLRRGQEQFNIFCAPCHGYNGRGNGMVNRYVTRLRARGDIAAAGTWVQPTDLTGPGVQYMPAGGIYSVITNGLAAMAAYKDQIPLVDRWAIVAYVRALGLSEKAVAPTRLPPAIRARLTRP